MHRVALQRWAVVACGAVSCPAPRPACVTAPPCTLSSSLTQPRRHLHGSGLCSPTRPARFDLRKHEMEKRRRRELEKAGIDPADESDAPWIAPEEQQRLDEEEEQRRAEMEEQRQAFLKKRAEEDAVKRQKFKEFRAKQIAMSRHRKEALADKKEEARQHRQETSRVTGAEDDDPAESEEAGTAATASAGTDEDNTPDTGRKGN